LTLHGKDPDQRLIKAMAHPLRVRIYRILCERVASPVQMADLIEQPLPNVAYHTGVLLEYDCIQLVETQPRRGAVEHFYRVNLEAAIGSTRWQELPEILREDVTAVSLTSFIERATAALEAGAFQGRKSSAFSWQPMLVDEDGWREILRIVKEGQERIRQVGEESAKRIGDSRQGVSIAVAHSAFETPD
jgi:DNA-binding transcriptional ArsR family regulator